MTKATIVVTEFINNKIFCATEDGEKVYKKLKQYMEDPDVGHIRVDLTGADYVIPCFIMAAFGPLYNGTYTHEVLKERITVTVNVKHQEVIEHSLLNCKKYYEHKEAYDRAWAEVIGSIDEDEV